MQFEYVEIKYLKCKHLTFFRHSKIDTLYCNENAALDKVKTILDLSILLDNRLRFRDNISMIVNKAYGILGYMKRWSKQFTYIHNWSIQSFSQDYDRARSRQQPIKILKQ